LPSVGPSPSPSESPSPSPSPEPTTVYVAAQPPAMTLAAARAGVILPLTVLLGLISLVVSSMLLFGDRVTARLAPAAGRIRRASPIAKLRRKRSQEGGP
jgi:hypothetical protein